MRPDKRAARFGRRYRKGPDGWRQFLNQIRRRMERR